MVVASVIASTGATPASARASSAERVRLPFPAYDGTLTPYTFSLGYPLVTLVYDTLLWRDAAGIPQPWLARSVTRSNGGRRLTITLRDGVRWHDGRPLTAADVAFTLRFVARHYHPRFTPGLGDIRRVRTDGKLKLTVDLRQPSLGFDNEPLADLPILPEHLWRGLPAERRAPRGLPVGSGPYRLVSESPKAGYVFRANPDYALGMPQVGEIRVPIIRDADATYDALRDRDVDMVPLNLPADVARSLGSALGINLRSGPSYTGTALALNVRRAPFDDLAARQAVAGAMNLERIVRKVAPAVAADQGYVHPASPWSAGAMKHRFEPEAARRVLGSRVISVLAPSNDPVRLEAGRQVVLALRLAGARATLAARTRNQIERATGADGSPPDFDAAIQSTPPLSSYDPDNLVRIFGSDPRDAPLNVMGYRSRAFEQRAREVAAAPDEPARQRATTAELDLLARDAPAIPLFFSQGNFAYRPAIYDGWVFVKGTGMLDKRSFLPVVGAEAPAGPAAGADPEPVGLAADSGSGLSLANIISLAVLAVVLVLAAIALRQRRRDRR